MGFWTAFLLWTLFIVGLIYVLNVPVKKIALWTYYYARVLVNKLLKGKVDKVVPVQKPVIKPKLVAPKPAERKKAKVSAPAPVRKKQTDGFVLPSVDLLDEPKAQNKENLTREMMDNVSRRLESILAQFGVKGEVVRVSPGPVVTLYEFEPAAGVKTARVIGLAEDMARAMSVVSVRMAVVPGSSVIGIEIPNKTRQTVYIKEIMDTNAFADNTGTLPLILGKNIGGNPVFADLAKMPHLLVAGTTGSGKSVGINTMILSLLYRFTPSQCKLIMVDPKMLELSVYNGIPHLLTPVVTEPGKAVVALKWAVKEMDDRYKAMATMGVRNIEGYNKKIADTIAAGKTLTRQIQTGFDPETGRPIIETQEMDLTPLPYIVVIVDEMADLMLTAGKDVEIAIQRIAQKARASGIHLIMATQRPSVDVITGTIKSNFPSRISFQVTSKIDSRTILGEQGAEQLLGRGDMLFMPAGVKPIRLHGPFVSDDEVERVVTFLKSQGEAQYNEAVTIDENTDVPVDEGAVFDRTAMGGAGGGDLYQQAVDIVLTDKRPTISYIQRKLGIGYNRAADLIDRMEQEGIVSKASPTGRREILVGDDK
ncbi:MAG: DNA translocase FtsK [Alphaproteobacteria bacterium]|nr:DNA translocase FtsK [Alphaproteobacteria bacterium]